MPSSTERTTKRRKRAAAALGIMLVIAGGLAYATTRDGEPTSTAAPAGPLDSDAPADTPADPNAAASTDPEVSDTPAGPTKSSGSSSDPVVSTTPASPHAPADPAGSDPAVISEVPPLEVDTELEIASRNPTVPAVVPATNFTVSGSPGGVFRPGISRPVNLTITNPSASDLTVTAVNVAVGPASLPACGAENLIVTQHFSGSVVVPAHTTRSLSALNVPESQWPILSMPNTSFNQDACQQATFQLTYTGTGSIPS